MFRAVDTKDTGAVGAEVRSLYLEIFPGGDPALVSRIFECVTKCFRGDCDEYQAIDTQYHDLEHTMQGTLCLVRLLASRQRASVVPPLDQRHFELGLLAILLHDTGYAKRRDDPTGTGAKYTFTHVDRSARFAADLLRPKGFNAEEIKAVQNMIRCTGVHANLQAIPFQSELERVVGCALATADLLGQMAALDYVDKLPALYEEFAEAAEFSDGRVPASADFRSVEHLLRNTPQFWQNYVRVRIEQDFGGLYHFLENPYPGGRNEYVEKVEANIERIRRQFCPPSSAMNRS